MSEPATNTGMNTLVAVAIAPCGTGDELSAEVAEVVRVIRESGLQPHHLDVHRNRGRLGRGHAGRARRNLCVGEQGHPHRSRAQSRYSTWIY